MDICIREKVAAVSTGVGNPGPFISHLERSGVVLIPAVASVAWAKRWIRMGGDAIERG